MPCPKCTMQAKSVNLTKVLFLQSSSPLSPFHDSCNLQDHRHGHGPRLTDVRPGQRQWPSLWRRQAVGCQSGCGCRYQGGLQIQSMGEATENRQPHCEVRIMFHRVIDQTPFAIASPHTHTLDPFFPTSTTAPHQAPGHRHDRRRRRRSGEPGFDAHVDAILQWKEEDRGLRLDQVSAIASHSLSIH